jgi:hypothetical protein
MMMLPELFVRIVMISLNNYFWRSLIYLDYLVMMNLVVRLRIVNSGGGWL